MLTRHAALPIQSPMPIPSTIIMKISSCAKFKTSSAKKRSIPISLPMPPVWR